jgi:hypothetical protein
MGNDAEIKRIYGLHGPLGLDGNERIRAERLGPVARIHLKECEV